MFFGTVRHFPKQKIFQKFQVFFPKKMFCAFSALEIAPTLDVLLLFFLQTTILTLIGPLFRNNPETTKPLKAKSRQGKRSPKGPPFIFYFFKETYKTGRAQRVPPLDFFGTVRLFSENFLLPEGPLRVF